MCELVELATLLSLCNMESLINDLRHQYAASASVAVSQAMLLQALNQTTRQVANKISQQSQRKPASHDDDARHLLNQTKQSNNNIETPLDLSVRSPPSSRRASAHQVTRSRTHGEQQQLTHLGDSIEGDNHHQPKKNTQIRKQSQDSTNPLIHSKFLITSSTSPTSSGSTSSSSSSSTTALVTTDANKFKATTCYLYDSNNNQLEAGQPPPPEANLFASNDVISSTNGCRQRRQQNPAGCKKQKRVRSHLCNFCGRSFSRSDMLTRHSRLHSGLKPYQCGKCYQVFSRSDHLSTHERTHTGEKPYQCNYCDYSACRRDMITRHMRTHTAARVAIEQGELETRVRARRRRLRTNAKSADSSDKDIKEDAKDNVARDDDVSSSFEISVTDS